MYMYMTFQDVAQFDFLSIMNDFVVVAQYKVMEYNRTFPTTIQNKANKFQPPESYLAYKNNVSRKVTHQEAY